MHDVPPPQPRLEPSWLAALGAEFEQPYMHELKRFLVQERAQHVVYPPGQEMFAAFDLTPFHQVRVVILGQDPYHGPGQAHGLAFSVRRGVRIPPSLMNMLIEINTEIGIPKPPHGDLTHWARQGVLLLNTALSVRARQANSHRGQGWERFTDAAIQALAERRQGLVFLLWGSAAGRKASMID
ncbi:MAG: uracil-DNA glycosylase, partial [Myxococcales bacterium]|nr:uracil-DNA glycosylase [Myxococcales bacterium]